jgi:hypothetical protein
MPLPAIAAGVGAVAKAIPPWMWAALGGKMIADTFWDPVNQALFEGPAKRRLLQGELELGKKRLESENETAKRVSEENRKSTDMYMAMLSKQSKQEREDRSQDRQTQLLMAMMANQQGLQAGTAQAFENTGPSHPYAASALLRRI